MIGDADLVVAMAGEHREAAAELVPAAASRTYTLKELVRLLETVDRIMTSTGRGPQTDDDVGSSDDVAADLGVRIAQAHAARTSGGEANPWDEDVVDPLGLPLDTYRAVAWELEGWSDRLVDRLFGPVAAAVPGEANGR